MQQRSICEPEQTLPGDMLQDLQIIRSILQAYGATRIILYGSLARGDYRTDSDIDICVEGIPNQWYFRALAECILKIERPVTVLDFQNVTGYLRERILNEGVMLYES